MNTVSEPRILDVYKADSLPRNAVDKLVDALRRFPQDVADAFRHFHRQRTPLNDGDYDDVFSRMVDKLGHIFGLILSDDDSETWGAIAGSDLLEAYIDIVTDDAFFFEPRVRK